MAKKYFGLKRSDIDFPRCNFYEENGYCTECHVYHNDGVTIRVTKNAFGVYHSSLCESCKIKALPKEAYPGLIKLNEFNKQKYYLSYFYSYFVDIILKGSFCFDFVIYNYTYNE